MYKIVFILSIFVNLIFLFILRNSNGYKSNFDYFIIFFTLLFLILLLLGIRIITPSLLSIILFIANLKYINLSSFIRKDFKIKLFLLLVLFSLFLCNLTPERALGVNYRNGIMELNGGFDQHNVFAGFALFVIISYILLIGNKRIYSLKYILIILFIFLFFFFLTDSRGFLISGVILLILLLMGKWNTAKHLLERFSLFIILIISIISVWIPLNIYQGSSNFSYYNKLFSNRLELQHLAVLYYPIKLLGYNKVDVRGWLSFYNNYNEVPIDNTYLILLLFGGIFGFLIFEYIFLRACYIAMRYDNYLLCVIFISLALFSVVEDTSSLPVIYAPIICSYIIEYSYKYKFKGEDNFGSNKKNTMARYS